jgi:hypothetical protein
MTNNKCFKKAEYHITDLLIGTLIMGIFASCLFAFWQGTSDHYNTNPDTAQFNNFNQINKTETEVATPMAQGYDVGAGSISGNTNFYSEGQIKVGWNSLGILLRTPAIVGNLISTSMNISQRDQNGIQLGLPTEVWVGFAVILAVIVVSALIALYFRRLP